MPDVVQAIDAAVADSSDEELLELIAELGGTQYVLEQGFEQFRLRLDPDAARDCAVCWRLSGPDGMHPYTIVVQGTEATVSRGESKDAQLTFALSVPDYLRLVRGCLDAPKAVSYTHLTLPTTPYV